MPGTYIKPKAFNRRFFINLGTSEAPKWAEIAKGISSRGTSVNEGSEDYYYMDNRGTAETVPTTQSISRTFSGNRLIGDEAQDEIFIKRLYDLNNRTVEFLDFYDALTTGANGWKGNGSITISDDGSGDTANRENIGFGLTLNGIPTRGTVTVDDKGVPTFVAEVAP